MSFLGRLPSPEGWPTARGEKRSVGAAAQPGGVSARRYRAKSPSRHRTINQGQLEDYMSTDRQPRRSYSNATIAALMTLARGGCYAPGCGVPTIRMIEGAPVFNLEIAHIQAFEEGGKRFNAALSVKERNSFNNLLLLCTAHHKVVDGAGSGKYSVRVLLGWKRDRESDGLDALAGLGEITEARLALLISAAQEQFLDRVGPILADLGRRVPELSGLLKVAISELKTPRQRSIDISEDGITMLHSAARSLAHLQDTAGVLAGAADDLRNLDDYTTSLQSAARDIKTAANAIADARY
jgi:hypothetical protein